MKKSIRFGLYAAMMVLISSLSHFGCQKTEPTQPTEQTETNVEEPLYRSYGVSVFKVNGHPDQKLVTYTKVLVLEIDRERLISWKQALAVLSDDAMVKLVQVSRTVVATAIMGDELFLTEFPPDSAFSRLDTDDDDVVGPCVTCPACPPGCNPCSWGDIKDCYR